jgi:hypothetical protein
VQNRHYEVSRTNPSLIFSDSDLAFTDPTDDLTDGETVNFSSEIQKYLDFSTDFDLEHLPSPYQSRGVRAYTVNGAYKTKDKKVQPVDQADEEGKKPGGRRDWYSRSKTRDTPQEQIGIYQQYILPRISDIPRQSRLTPERMKELDIGDLQPAERMLLEEVLINREKAFAFEWPDCGQIHEDVSPPIEINTIEHKAWQAANFPCPKPLLPLVVKMLKDRLDRGVLEYSEGPYRNPWFLVKKKKPGEYRLINSATHLNAVTRRDANLPPSVDEFANEFAGCHIASLVDLYSGYDQMLLHPKSRDLTAFFTPLGLLRCTTLPQGATNSVAQFVRIMNLILEDINPEVAMPFLDDVGVKGPYTNYDDNEALPGIRRYVLEHIQNLDKTLERIERAGASIGAKSQFCKDGLNVVGFVCNSKGREPSADKVIKITNWKTPENAKEAKGFLGLCVYFRIWVKDFGTIADPIYSLLRKGVKWYWDPELQGKAMKTLQQAMITAPILVKIDYSPGAGEIVVGVDASLEGYGGYLGQRDLETRRVRPARYESGVWSQAERNYDATKRECRGVLKILKKLQVWIIGCHFILETDANVLVAQLNRAATDHPGALITRWLAWIRLFDFEVRHIPGKQHTAADALSRRPRHPEDTDSDEEKEDIDDWILSELGAYEICPIGLEHDQEEEEDPELRNRRQILQHMKDVAVRLRTEGEVDSDSDNESSSNKDLEYETPISSSEYDEESIRIATYLTTLKKPKDISGKEFRKFKKEALKYGVHGRKLWRLPTKGMPIKLVVDKEEMRAQILRDVHDKSGHKGRESTYHRVSQRYFWNGCYSDVKSYVKTCRECQFRSAQREEEPLYPTASNGLMEKWAVDITYMPGRRGKQYLIIARDDMSGWVEARAVANKEAKTVALFIWEDIICRHGVFWRMIVDGGGEFKSEVIDLLNKWGVDRIQVSAYHAPANGMIERGHQPLKNALSKLGDDWVINLAAVLFADRTTVHGPTGYTPFYMVYGREPILPVESRFPTWRTIFTEEVTDRSKLLELRARQFQMREEDAEEAIYQKTRRRQEGKEVFDARHRIRSKPLERGDIVLRHDSVREIDMSSRRKLDFRWLGPYQIYSANKEKGYYKLKELGPDGALLRGTFSGSRLKLFYQREQYFYSPDDVVSSPNTDSYSDYQGNIEVQDRDTVQLRIPERRQHQGQQLQMDTTRTGFVIRVPTLTPEQRSQYARFSNDEK